MNQATEKPAGSAATLSLATLSLLVIQLFLFASTPEYKLACALVSLSLWTVIALLIWIFCSQHQFTQFGYANVVTTARALATALLAGLIPVAAVIDSSNWMWAIAITATITLCLDGVDGFLARKTGMCSAFGARFDMETDALLALVITVFIWQSGHVGEWVLALGVMRYAFLGAALWLDFLRAELYPSMRRKTVCVIQVGALCLMLCPWLSSLQASIVGAAALLCLSYSFTTDVYWLFRRRHTRMPNQQH
ncbi:MAG: CDP-alcohol phosphatidyltransferase family protein [Granulosicoccus sp.]